MNLKPFTYRGFTFMPCAWQESARWHVQRGIVDERSCPQFNTKPECREWADQQAAFDAADKADRARRASEVEPC